MGFFDQQRASWMPSSLMAGGIQPTMPSPALQAVAPAPQGQQASFMGSQPGLMSPASQGMPWLEGGGNTFSGGGGTSRYASPDRSREYAEGIATREGWNNPSWGSWLGRAAGVGATAMGAPTGVGMIPGAIGKAVDQYGILNPALAKANRAPNTFLDFLNIFSSPTEIAVGRLADQIRSSAVMGDEIANQGALTGPQARDIQYQQALEQSLMQQPSSDGGGGGWSPDTSGYTNDPNTTGPGGFW